MVILEYGTIVSKHTEMDASQSLHVNPARLVAACVIGALDIALNTVTFVTLRKRENKCFGEITTLFIQSLALNDLYSGVQLTVMETTHTVLVPLGRMWSRICYIFTIVLYTQLTFSAMLLCCLSLDRFIAIAYPLRYPSILTVGRSKRIVILTFIACLSVSVTCVTVIHFKIATIDFDEVHRYCATGELPEFQKNFLFIIVSVVGAIIMLLPFVLTSALNLPLLFIVAGHIKRRQKKD